MTEPFDTEENAFNTWILIGNALHATLRGNPGDSETPARDRLAALDAALQPVQPPQMLTALAALPPEDRALILQACEQALTAAGPEAETKLGLDIETAAPILNFLRS